MKKALVVLFCLISNFCYLQNGNNFQDDNGLKQGRWLYNYDDQWQLTHDSTRIEYYRIINFVDDIPNDTVRDFYKNGQVQWEGFLYNVEPDSAFGYSRYYYSNGQIESEGFKVKNKEDGIWKYYTEDGRILMKTKWHYGESKNHKYLIDQFYYSIENNKLSQAKRHLRRANQRVSKDFLVKEKDYANALIGLTVANFDIGDYKAVDKRFKEALKITQNYGDKDKYLEILDQFATYSVEIGNFQIADTLYSHFLKCVNNGAYTETSCAIFYNKLSTLFLSTGKTEFSKFLIDKLLGLFSDGSLNKNSSEYSDVLINLSQYYANTGEYLKADSTYKECIRLLSNILGETNYKTADLKSQYAYFIKDYDREDEALTLFEEALPILELDTHNVNNYSIALNNCSILYQSLGNYKNAELNFRKSLDITAEIHGKESVDYAINLSNLGYLNYLLGQQEKYV